MSILLINTGLLVNGVKYYEYHVGDFVDKEGQFVTSIRFTAAEASALGALLRCFADPSLIAIALYPWVEPAWESLTTNGWTTMMTKTFRRHRWLGSGGSQRWVVGRAHSEDKFMEIIQWTWTLPGRDTLLFIPITNTDIETIGALVSEFKDDQEDNDVNELRLLRHYPIVASRGFEGRYLRVFSTTLDETTFAGCVTRARASLVGAK